MPDPTANANKGNGTEAKPADAPTQKQKVAGSYEIKIGEDKFKYVLLEDGGVENYMNNKKTPVSFTWEKKDDEVHVKAPSGVAAIFRVDPDGGLTRIGTKNDAERVPQPENQQHTWKKISSITKETASNGNDNNGTELKLRNLTTEKKLVGTYERIDGNGVSDKYVLLQNGSVEWHRNGKERKGDINWKIGQDGTLHFLLDSGAIAVYRINKDSSLTSIRLLKPNGKPFSKKFNDTYIKIK